MNETSLVRWHIIYNMTVIRILSFGMDLYWSKNHIMKFDEKVIIIKIYKLNKIRKI